MLTLTEAIGLTLFPAMMAFAASSDLFTMTIANRVSLILVAGFGVLAAMTGMSAADALSHAGAAVAVLAVVLFFSARLDWRRRCEARGGDGVVAGLCPPRRLSPLCVVARRRVDRCADSVSRPAAAAVFVGREWAERLHRRGGGVPYGVALAAAALLVYPQTEWTVGLVFAPERCRN